MASRALIPVLVTMMLITGVCNTLLTKYQVRLSSFLVACPGPADALQDLQCVRNCDAKDPKQRQHFEQPVIQT